MNPDFDISMASRKARPDRVLVTGLLIGLTCGTLRRRPWHRKWIGFRTVIVRKRSWHARQHPEGSPRRRMRHRRSIGEKFAVGVGGSYGRGVMTCRSGQAFDDPGRSNDDRAEGAVGLPARWPGDRLRAPRDERSGADSILSSKVAGWRRSAAAGPKGRTAGASTDWPCRRRF